MPFDIRAAVAEVPESESAEETPTVDFTFEIKLAKKLKDARAAAEPDEGAIAALEAQLEAATYVAELISVPRRRREDIYSEALDKFPAKPSVFGQDEKANFLRGNYVRLAVTAAGIKKITDPRGEVNDTPEAVWDTIEYINAEAPDQIFERIERAVQVLNDEEDAQDALHKSADF